MTTPQRDSRSCIRRRVARKLHTAHLYERARLGARIPVHTRRRHPDAEMSRHAYCRIYPTRGLGLPLTVNAPLHRANIDRLERIIAMAQQLGAIKVELANVQFYGWAMRNRAWLLPTPAQIARAERIAVAARERLAGTMQVVWVTPDYYADRPKPCMNGWGQRYVTINPVGDALPCPTAGEIQSLRFDNVREYSLEWLWHDSPAFNRFRGTAWMPEPCRSCDRREIDFGGCRCQAFLLTGDASNTDPACTLSPHHREIVASVQEAQEAAARTPLPADSPVPLTYRQNPLRTRLTPLSGNTASRGGLASALRQPFD